MQEIFEKILYSVALVGLESFQELKFRYNAVKHVHITLTADKLIWIKNSVNKLDSFSPQDF